MKNPAEGHTEQSVRRLSNKRLLERFEEAVRYEERDAAGDEFYAGLYGEHPTELLRPEITRRLNASRT